MKPYLTELVAAQTSLLRSRNATREYLQARILESLQRAGAMIPLAFHGGTALRFLYAIPRYSEDLDFAMERAGDQYDLQTYLKRIKSDLTAEGYEIAIKLNDRRTVHSAFVRFPGLLYELGLSSHQDETVAVKLEIDTNPPAGAGLSTTVIRRHVMLNLQHHDRASLLSGKLHAVLQRPYLKGRDLYDLMWYLSDPDWPEPNLALLNNALRQTGWEGKVLSKATWRGAVRARLKGADAGAAVSEVQPFLDRMDGGDLLTIENLVRLLSG